MDKALSYAQAGNEHMYKSYMSRAASQDGQIQYLLVNKEAVFDAKVDQKTSAYGCNEVKTVAYWTIWIFYHFKDVLA